MQIKIDITPKMKIKNCSILRNNVFLKKIVQFEEVI